MFTDDLKQRLDDAVFGADDARKEAARYLDVLRRIAFGPTNDPVGDAQRELFVDGARAGKLLTNGKF